MSERGKIGVMEFEVIEQSWGREGEGDRGYRNTLVAYVSERLGIEKRSSDFRLEIASPPPTANQHKLHPAYYAYSQTVAIRWVGAAHAIGICNHCGNDIGAFWLPVTVASN